MTERPPPRQWKWHPWALLTAGAGSIALRLAGESDPDRELLRRIPAKWQDAIGAAFLAAFWIVAGLWLWRAVRTRGRGPGHGPEDLGHPYEFELELAHNGDRVKLRVALARRTMSFDLLDARARFGALDPPLPPSVRVEDVRALRPEPSRLVLDVETAEGPQTVTLIPGSYADRQRFLWEVAVLRPDLFDAPAPQPA
jgi:hypothetical protein